MPQASQRLDLGDLVKPAAAPSQPNAGGLDLTGLVQPGAEPEKLSALSRGVEALVTPLVSREQAARFVGAPSALSFRGFVDTLKATGGALKDLPGLLWREPLATLKGAARGAAEGPGLLVREPFAVLKGFGQGAVEGASTLSDPLSVAALLTGGAARAARPALVRALRAIPAAERALIAARIRGDLPTLQALRAELASLRSNAEIRQVFTRFLRGVDVGASGALAAGGVEKLATAESLPEAGAGLAEVAAGALGVKTATPVPKLGRAIPTHAGELAPARGFMVDRAGRAVPTAEASRLADVPAPDTSEVRGVRAAVADRDLEGRAIERRIFSGDVAAKDAPLIALSDLERRELRRMLAEMENFQFTPKTFNRVERGAGGAFEVVGGAAGAPVYDDIVGFYQSPPSRAQVTEAIRKALRGEHTAVGQRAIEVMRMRVAGDPTVSPAWLPDEAGDETLAEWLARREADTAKAEASAFETFGRDVDELAGAGVIENEPGAAGFGRVGAMQSATGGAGGALVGAATGEDTEDRIKRAVTFGAAGALAPVLFKSGPGRGAARREAARAAGSASAGPEIKPDRLAARRRGPFLQVDPDIASSLPRAEAIRASRALPLRSIEAFPDVIKPDVRALLEKHGGFTAQRRGVQSVERTAALAERVPVPLEQVLRPGTALNAAELQAYKDAVSTVVWRSRQLASKVARGQASDLDRLQLSRLNDEAAVLLASYRGAVAEAGRALNICRRSCRTA